MNHLVIGTVELEAAVVGLLTGLLYSWVRAPIPAPGVLGGIFAIWGTFAGLVIVQLLRHQLILGH